MSDLLKDTRNAIAMFDGDLVIGNHDSITLLGSQSQVKLRNYSRSISNLLFKNTDELEVAINDVVSEIEKFEEYVTKKSHLSLGIHNRHKEITRAHSKIVAYIEQVCLFFQMQQAQLIKEVKLLEKLSVTVHESTTALEECIKVGQEVLRKRPPSDKRTDSYSPQNFMDDTEDINTWYSRLERRIDDLSVSHTVALQNQAQIKILHDNNLILLDRISAVISNTFPIWQSQMIMILGIERLNKRLNDQDKVLHNSSRQSKQLDVDRIAVLNNKLKTALKETVSLEKQDLVIRKDIQETLYYVERG